MKNKLSTMISIHYSLFALCFVQTTFSFSIPSVIPTGVEIPKIKLNELQTLLSTNKNDLPFDLDILKDGGGNLGIVEIANLGLNYQKALALFQLGVFDPRLSNL